MAEHTPGPWTTDQVRGGFNVGIIIPPRGKRDYSTWHRIARVGAELGDVPEHHDEPNARLIAAAPDLMEAAVVVLDEHDMLAGSDCPCGCFGALRDAVKKAAG